MRRIKVILAVAALVVAMLVATAAPAMAHNNGDFFRGSNDFRVPNGCFNGCFNTGFTPFFLSPFVGFNTFEGEDDFNNGCFNDGFNRCGFNDGANNTLNNSFNNGVNNGIVQVG